LRFSLIGPGRVGAALARRLVERGWTLEALAARSIDSARRAAEWIGAGRAAGEPADAARAAPLVLLTVPDRAIAPLCEALARAEAFSPASIVLHTSGALSSAALAPARDLCGAAVGSLHPLQSFASPEQALGLLRGVFFCAEGDPPALEAAARIAKALEARFVTIRPESKALYHAGACAASNFLVALEDLAVQLLAQAGIRAPDALQMLLPLVRGTIANLQHLGLPDALTGPVARGDSGTVERHRQAIRDNCPQLLEAYDVLTELTRRVAARMVSETE
jgi:predicted short-subunit dehydrogenase-like oxidoreductase (DUF2520 family)